MLVLTRKIGEEIVIGDNIHIMVVGVHGATVRIGISAPRDVDVDRQEVAEMRKHCHSKKPSLSSPPTNEKPDESLPPLVY